MEKEALERFERIESLLAAVARSNLEAREEARQQDARFNARMERWEQRMDRWEQRMERVEARMDRADARMDRFDRRLEATRKVVQNGMKMLVKLEQSQAETTATLKALIKAQQRTETTLQAFIASFTKGGNGRFRH